MDDRPQSHALSPVQPGERLTELRPLSLLAAVLVMLGGLTFAYLVGAFDGWLPPRDENTSSSYTEGFSNVEQSVPARGNLANYFSADDYPTAAILQEQQGTTGFRLKVGADGRVTSCTISKSSGHSVLDRQTCRILRQRAKFQPAKDSAGRPAPDEVSGRIRWQLPEP